MAKKKINKNQALYRALPKAWTTGDFLDRDYKYSCKVSYWKTKEVTYLDKTRIAKEIGRRLSFFKLSGGKLGDVLQYPDFVDTFDLVEADVEVDSDEGREITARIDPKTFYCVTDKIVVSDDRLDSAPICRKCKKKMAQLQMVYACECGCAEGVTPNPKDGEVTYNPIKSNPKSNYWFIKSDKSRIQMRKPCQCGGQMWPYNATDSKLFYSQVGSIVNLYDQGFSKLLSHYKEKCESLLFAKWFNCLKQEEFKTILENPTSFFESKAAEVDKAKRDYEALLAISPVIANSLSFEDYLATVTKVQPGISTIQELQKLLQTKIDLSEFSPDKYSSIASSLVEYDVLKYPLTKISLQDALLGCVSTGEISDEEEITTLLNTMHISDAQVSQSVKIAKFAYGFTRLRSHPAGFDDPLTMRSFSADKKRVYVNPLDTEGLLINVDLKKIYEWIVEQNEWSVSHVEKTDESLKRWFLENVHQDYIGPFNSIPAKEHTLITKLVYSLLHTISHLAIRSAGVYSGIGRDSMSEIIFPALGAIFIYPTTAEGATLGAMSGMFESRLKQFSFEMLEGNKACSFDPVCTTTENGACFSCAYLNEVSCVHFNRDVSRSYLYGGNIIVGDDTIVVKKGFWSKWQ